MKAQIMKRFVVTYNDNSKREYVAESIKDLAELIDLDITIWLTFADVVNIEYAGTVIVAVKDDE